MRLQHARGIVALSNTFAIPLAVHLVNGSVKPWAFILGAAFGIAWYFVPFFLPL